MIETLKKIFSDNEIYEMQVISGCCIFGGITIMSTIFAYMQMLPGGNELVGLNAANLALVSAIICLTIPIIATLLIIIDEPGRASNVH